MGGVTPPRKSMRCEYWMATAVTSQLFLGVTRVTRSVRETGWGPEAARRPSDVAAVVSAAEAFAVLTAGAVTAPAVTVSTVLLVIPLMGPRLSRWGTRTKCLCVAPAPDSGLPEAGGTLWARTARAVSAADGGSARARDAGHKEKAPATSAPTVMTRVVAEPRAASMAALAFSGTALGGGGRGWLGQTEVLRESVEAPTDPCPASNRDLFMR
ncbi:hypothetical protein GCM10009574_066130 [Streptomyces asiaticus]|uniref:Uncharacterized protein n=2 Tax=Streptomyces rhizosphaericus TaxID=114699 RepID=A0ABP3ZYD2_9ACTN